MTTIINQLILQSTDPISGHIDEAKLTALVLDECRNALCPQLRDMVSRGHAFQLIKQRLDP